MAGIDWQRDPEPAFAAARAAGRPLLLYWGARWCPPCNRIKALAFTHPKVERLAHSLVALHVDGDDPLAQQLAERLALRSYPTFVLYRPSGEEITRLPCELDGDRFAEILSLALDARHTAAETLAAALSGERKLTDAEWRLLSHYSWDTDERQLLGTRSLDELAALLAGTVIDPDASLRFDLLALQAAASAGRASADRAAAMGRVCIALEDPRAVREHMDLFIGWAATLARYLTDSGSPERNVLTARWSTALATLEADPTLNPADRLASVRARVRLARLSHPSDNLGAAGPQQVADALAAAADPAMRHAVVNTGAGLLIDATLPADAERILLAELDTSHSPYYFMHTLATLAKRRGDAVAAAGWYERAWRQAIGPATRIQWGAAWLQGLVDLLPQDAPRIEAAAREVLQHIDAVPDAASQRNRTQAKRLRDNLAAWQGSGPDTAALRARLDAILA